MRSVWLLLICCVSATNAFARLGDTLDQTEARYGLEKKKNLPGGTAKLLEGSREPVFEYEGWRIRCAMLQATDGNFYVVREEYRKIFNGEIMKAGGVIQIRDFERDAVFQAEGGSWQVKALAEAGPDLISSAANQLLRTLRITKVWMRSDGAIARINIGDITMILDLPQALNYEAQLEGIKDQQQRDAAQRLIATQLPAAETPAPKSATKPAHTQIVSSPKPQPSKATTPAPSIPSTNSSTAFPSVGSLVVLIGIGGLASIVLSKKSKRPPQRRNSSVEPPRIPASVPPPLPLVTSKLRTVKDLTWDEFELLVGEIYRRQGFTVEISAGTGADGGIDLILHRIGERVLVQCKSWNVYKVAAPAVREFYGVLVAEKADRGIFVTTGQFTRDAKDFAVGKPIEMLDGPAFQTLLQNASIDPNDDLLNVGLWAPVFFAASRVTIPPCPFCKSEMVKRQGRSGAFFGCPTYPRCRGKREIRKHVSV